MVITVEKLIGQLFLAKCGLGFPQEGCGRMSSTIHCEWLDLEQVIGLLKALFSPPGTGVSKCVIKLTKVIFF